ncbi:gamma-glutamyltransferase [Nonomuraea typhae]|uniref:gamma-glutamyltransferase n=1 Tax=Nonomuraea typhae TaxID=2603600 RepID=UPI0012FC9DA5|nr:gamma-glutamyltransferase [Nonomuraea typhae]
MSGVPARPATPNPAHVSATGRKGMISTSHPAASAAGQAVLRKGGSAIDAYIAAAAVQTVVEPTMTTLAGGLAVTVYDPQTRQSGLVAGMVGLPAGEPGNLDAKGHLSGRTVPVPGWVRGAHAAWKRWGRLSWAELFADAIVAAREGFVADQLLWGWTFEYRMAAGRYQEGRDTWFPGGYQFRVGEVLRQPALAGTLEQLAEQGPDYFYEGDFAKKYVDTARRHGGRITLDDLAASAAIEMPALPSLPTAGGYEIHTVGALYGVLLSLSSLIETDDLYTRMRIMQEAWAYGLDEIPDFFSDPTVSIEETLAAVSPEAAEKLVPRVLHGKPRPFDAMSMGTNAIVVVDEQGQIAHGTHSSSSPAFGIGLLTDGVIMPRPATLFAAALMKVPVGWGTSLLAIRDGKPAWVAGSPAISAVENVFQNSVNVLHRGMTPAESVNQPMFGASIAPSTLPMVEASFGDTVLDDLERRGIGITRVSPWELEMGSCQGIAIGEDGTLHGVADPRRIGQALGH